LVINPDASFSYVFLTSCIDEEVLKITTGICIVNS
jgi:hypothetical protein